MAETPHTHQIPPNNTTETLKVTVVETVDDAVLEQRKILQEQVDSVLARKEEEEVIAKTLEDNRSFEQLLQLTTAIVKNEPFFEMESWNRMMQLVQSGVDTTNYAQVDDRSKIEISDRLKALYLQQHGSPRYEVEQCIRRLPHTGTYTREFYVQKLLYNLGLYMREMQPIQLLLNKSYTPEDLPEFLSAQQGIDAENRQGLVVTELTLPFSYTAFENSSIESESPLQWSRSNVLDALFRYNIRLQYLPTESLGTPSEEADLTALLTDINIQPTQASLQSLRFVLYHISGLHNDIAEYAQSKNIPVGEVHLHEVFTDIQVPTLSTDFSVVIDQIGHNLPQITEGMSLLDILKISKFDFSTVQTSIEFQKLPENTQLQIYDELQKDLQKDALHQNKSEEQLRAEIDDLFAVLFNKDFKDTTLNNISSLRGRLSPAQQVLLQELIAKTLTTDLRECIKHSLLYTEANTATRKNIEETIAQIINPQSDSLTVEQLAKLYCINHAYQQDPNSLKGHPYYALQFFEIVGKNTEDNRAVLVDASHVFGGTMLKIVRDSVLYGETTFPEGVEMGQQGEDVISYTKDRAHEMYDTTLEQIDTLKNEEPTLFALLLSYGILKILGMAVAGGALAGGVAFGARRIKINLDKSKLADFCNKAETNTPSKMKQFRKKWQLASYSESQIQRFQDVAEELFQDQLKLEMKHWLTTPSKVVKSANLQRRAIARPHTLDDIIASLVKINKDEPDRVVKIVEPLVSDTNELLITLERAGLKRADIEKSLRSIQLRGASSRGADIDAITDILTEHAAIVDDLDALPATKETIKAKTIANMSRLELVESAMPSLRRSLAIQTVKKVYTGSKVVPEKVLKAIELAHSESSLSAKVRILSTAFDDLEFMDLAARKKLTRLLVRSGVTGRAPSALAELPITHINDAKTLLQIAEPEEVSGLIRKAAQNVSSVNEIDDFTKLLDSVPHQTEDVAKIRVASSRIQGLLRNGSGNLSAVKMLGHTANIFGVLLDSYFVASHQIELNRLRAAGKNDAASIREAKRNSALTDAGLGAIGVPAAFALSGPVGLVALGGVTIKGVTSDYLYDQVEDLYTMNDRYKAMSHQELIAVLLGKENKLIDTADVRENRLCAAVQQYGKNLGQSMLTFTALDQLYVDYQLKADSILDRQQLEVIRFADKASQMANDMSVYFATLDSGQLEDSEDVLYHTEMAINYAELQQIVRTATIVNQPEILQNTTAQLQSLPSTYLYDATKSPQELITSGDTTVLAAYKAIKAKTAFKTYLGYMLQDASEHEQFMQLMEFVRDNVITIEFITYIGNGTRSEREQREFALGEIMLPYIEALAKKPCEFTTFEHEMERLRQEIRSKVE